MRPAGGRFPRIDDAAHGGECEPVDEPGTERSRSFASAVHERGGLDECPVADIASEGVGRYPDRVRRLVRSDQPRQLGSELSERGTVRSEPRTDELLDLGGERRELLHRQSSSRLAAR